MKTIERVTLESQSCDMGEGYGKFTFSQKTTLRDFLKWYENNSDTWGTITILFEDGTVLRKFDYELYQNHIFYCHLSWEGNLKVEKASFSYCFMRENVCIYLNR